MCALYFCAMHRNAKKTQQKVLLQFSKSKQYKNMHATGCINYVWYGESSMNLYFYDIYFCIPVCSSMFVFLCRLSYWYRSALCWSLNPTSSLHCALLLTIHCISRRWDNGQFNLISIQISCKVKMVYILQERCALIHIIS